MKFITTLSALSAAVLAGDIDPKDGGAPNPNQVYIAGITYGGTGCPQNTVSAAYSADQKTVTLIFDQFFAETGKNQPSAARKSCQVNVDLRYPQGWSYSIFSVDYRGYVGIPAGMSAEQSATYYFSGSSNQFVSKTKFKGPFYNDYLNSDDIPTQNVVWSACGKVERGNVKAAVSINGDLGTPGIITVDSLDGKVTQIYGVQWKKC